jgi:hypothetical protein
MGESVSALRPRWQDGTEAPASMRNYIHPASVECRASYLGASISISGCSTFIGTISYDAEGPSVWLYRIDAATKPPCKSYYKARGSMELSEVGVVH